MKLPPILPPVLMCIAGSGCYSRTAGYDDVRSIVRERGGYDVRWRAVDSGGDVDKKTRKLLSAPLSAERAVALAVLHNQDLQASFEDLGREQAALLAARLPPNPEADVGFFFSGSNEDPDIELAITESLTGLAFLPLRQGVAEAALSAAALDVAGRTLDLAYEVRVAYIRYLAAHQLVELYTTAVEAAHAAYEVAQALHAAGNITDLDLHRERALYEQARLSLAQSELAVVTEREALNALMGIWGPDAAWKTAGRLPDPKDPELETRDLESRAVARSLDLSALERRFVASAKRADVAQAEGIVPDLRAGVGLEREDGHWEAGPVGGIEIPLFDHGQAEVRAAESDMRRARSEHRAAALRVRASARASGVRLTTARQRAIHYRDVILPLRKQILDDALLRYNAMATGVFELLAAKRDQLAAAREYVESLRDYWIARTQVEQLLRGRVPRDGVGSMPGPSDAAGTASFAAEDH